MIPIVVSQACVIRKTYYSCYETKMICIVESVNIHIGVGEIASSPTRLSCINTCLIFYTYFLN